MTENDKKVNKPRMVRTKRLFKRIFNVRGWSDWERVRSGGEYLKNGINKYFIPNSARGKQESREEKDPVIEKDKFEIAMKQMSLTEKDLDKREKSLFRLSLMMMVISLLVFIYVLYHLFYGTFAAMILSFSVMCIAGALAFRYHFWYFQIKYRRLGCSISEWYKYGLRGIKK